MNLIDMFHKIIWHLLSLPNSSINDLVTSVRLDKIGITGMSIGTKHAHP